MKAYGKSSYRHIPCHATDTHMYVSIRADVSKPSLSDYLIGGTRKERKYRFCLNTPPPLPVP